MRIAIIGYGKMGKTIERVALQRGHQISYRIDSLNKSDIYLLSPENTDVAIEFSQPDTAFLNLKHCLEQNVAIVCGTTGWLSQQTLVENICKESGGSFFYASNYSIGVNLFFRLNEIFAELMSKHADYDVSLEEIHHIEKLDAPSGTAISLAKDILKIIQSKKQWVKGNATQASDLGIVSKREDEVAGTHIVSYQSEIDQIDIKHTAFTREGFAQGAVMAAEWLFGKKGVFGMKDMLNF
jgi:4-hydroxy-tetrahydrodipicolinate reductase